jgi:drug/metabolite transporter (DMT)-like permease
VLHERVDARTILGTALVIGGIALVNARSLPWRRNVAAATAEEHAA